MGGHTVVPNGLPGSSEWLERLECAIPIHVVCHLLREYVKGIILELGGIMAKIHQILLRMRAFSIHHHPGQGMFASLRIRLRHFRTSFLWLHISILPDLDGGASNSFYDLLENRSI